MNYQQQLEFEKRGEEFMNQGKYDLAIKEFTRSLRIDSVESDCLHLRGKSYLAIGEFDLAITDFSSCIERLGDFDVDDAYPRSYEGREKAYRLSGDLKRAAEDLEQVNRLKKIPQTAEEFFERGKKYLAQGNFELALYDFDYAIDRGYITADYHKYRAKSYENLGEFDLAEEDLNRAQEIESNPPIRDTRDFHESTIEDWDRIIEESTRLIELNSDTTDYCNRGEAYLARGDFDLAISDFSYVIDVFEVSHEEFLESLEGRAEAYRAIGNFDLAEKDRKRVEEIHLAEERLDQSRSRRM